MHPPYIHHSTAKLEDNYTISWGKITSVDEKEFFPCHITRFHYKLSTPNDFRRCYKQVKFFLTTQELMIKYNWRWLQKKGKVWVYTCIRTSFGRGRIESISLDAIPLRYLWNFFIIFIYSDNIWCLSNFIAPC